MPTDDDRQRRSCDPPGMLPTVDTPVTSVATCSSLTPSPPAPPSVRGHAAVAPLRPRLEPPPAPLPAPPDAGGARPSHPPMHHDPDFHAPPRRILVLVDRDPE